MKQWFSLFLLVESHPDQMKPIIEGKYGVVGSVSTLIHLFGLRDPDLEYLLSSIVSGSIDLHASKIEALDTKKIYKVQEAIVKAWLAFKGVTKKFKKSEVASYIEKAYEECHALKSLEKKFMGGFAKSKLGITAKKELDQEVRRILTRKNEGRERTSVSNQWIFGNCEVRIASCNVLRNDFAQETKEHNYGKFD